jgi:hypothetical protein
MAQVLHARLPPVDTQDALALGYRLILNRDVWDIGSGFIDENLYLVSICLHATPSMESKCILGTRWLIKQSLAQVMESGGEKERYPWPYTNSHPSSP